MRAFFSIPIQASWGFDPGTDIDALCLQLTITVCTAKAPNFDRIFMKNIFFTIMSNKEMCTWQVGHE
jgi:hypothetical protein